MQAQPTGWVRVIHKNCALPGVIHLRHQKIVMGYPANLNAGPNTIHKTRIILDRF